MAELGSAPGAWLQGPNTERALGCGHQPVPGAPAARSGNRGLARVCAGPRRALRLAHGPGDAGLPRASWFQVSPGGAGAGCATTGRQPAVSL